MKRYKEQKVASYQDQLHRWQLIRLIRNGIAEESKPACMPEIHYQIRKDRKVMANTEWESIAKHKFANMISSELNQLNLF